MEWHCAISGLLAGKRAASRHGPAWKAKKIKWIEDEPPAIVTNWRYSMSQG